MVRERRKDIPKESLKAPNPEPEPEDNCDSDNNMPSVSKLCGNAKYIETAGTVGMPGIGVKADPDREPQQSTEGPAQQKADDNDEENFDPDRQAPNVGGAHGDDIKFNMTMLTAGEEAARRVPTGLYKRSSWPLLPRYMILALDLSTTDRVVISITHSIDSSESEDRMYEPSTRHPQGWQ